ncbi:MAG: linear amide C-N hydrolase, partial [Anaerolineales bacterium]
EPAWACTGFAALGKEGQRLMGRNFDWLLHPALLLYTDAPDGYASVSMVDLYYLGIEKQVTPDQRHLLLRAPYLPFDGMNERGLAVGMMAVPEADSGFDPDRVTISDLNLIRLVLDYAGSVDEAAELMGQYNVDFGGGPPIHYFLADSSGSSAVIEFVSGEMRVLPNQLDWQVSTNFLISEEHPEGANSSCWRYNQSYSTLEGAAGSLSAPAAMDLLERVSQEGEYGTRWSVVYGLDSGEITLAMGGEYGKVFKFNLGR